MECFERCLIFWGFIGSTGIGLEPDWSSTSIYFLGGAGRKFTTTDINYGGAYRILN